MLLPIFSCRPLLGQFDGDLYCLLAGTLRVQGAPGEGSVQVRGGARHQPGHRLPRHRRGRGAGTQGPLEHRRLPLLAVR